MLLQCGQTIPGDYLITVAQMLCTSKNLLMTKMTSSSPQGPQCTSKGVYCVGNQGHQGI